MCGIEDGIWGHDHLCIKGTICVVLNEVHSTLTECWTLLPDIVFEILHWS